MKWIFREAVELAFRCEDCRYVFQERHLSCPFCGEPLRNDGRSIDELLRAGFRAAPGEKRSASAAQPDDPLEELRRAYYQQQAQTARQPEPMPEPAPEPTPAPSRARIARPQPAQPETGSAASGPVGADYLAQAAGSSASHTLPVVEPPAPVTAPTPAPAADDPYEAELRRLERQRRRLDRQYRWNAVASAFANIRWNAVIRVVAVLFVVALVVSAWQMRYAIASALVSMILELLTVFMPVVLIIWGIWYLLRLFFR